MGLHPWVQQALQTYSNTLVVLCAAYYCISFIAHMPLTAAQSKRNLTTVLHERVATDQEV